MKLDHRHQLRFGSYATPRFRYDSTVNDRCRGEVVIVAISNGRIPWPLGRVRGNSNRALIVYGALARAVRREASQAVAYWWGVTAQTVTKWRKALGVVEQTEGDRAVRAEHGRRNWAKVEPKLFGEGTRSRATREDLRVTNGQATAAARRRSGATSEHRSAPEGNHEAQDERGAQETRHTPAMAQPGLDT